jgi:3-hydroxyisobutyrate dehydrogenase-like beta-hydroxyacid dehydrogenase
VSQVGVVGLGVMGSAVARRLLATGHAVRVYDIRAEAAAQLPGATAEPTPAAVAQARVVVLSLNTAEIVQHAVFGPNGMLSHAAQGVLVIDMSSIDPQRTREFAARAAELGAGWVDAPLSGGAPAVARGGLTLMVGGADQHVHPARAVLDVLATRVTHLGPAGSGQLVKLVNQVLVGCGFAALAEAAALVRAAGLPADRVLAALSGGRADSALLHEFFAKFVAVDLSPTGRVSNMVKDLETARDYARAANVPLPVTTLTSELHRWLASNGHGDADNAALMLYYAGGGVAS